MKNKRTTWCPPIGEGFIVSPSNDHIAEAVLKFGSEFWDHPAGCFDGGLFFNVDSQAVSELKLMYSHPDLFCVLFTDCRSGSERVLACNDHVDGFIMVKPGGNDWSLPRRYFVDRKSAWQAAEFFILSGEACPELHWLDFDPPEI